MDLFYYPSIRPLFLSSSFSKALRVNNGDVLGFDFLDPPSEQQILEVRTVRTYKRLFKTQNKRNLSIVLRIKIKIFWKLRMFLGLLFYFLLILEFNANF